MRSRVLVVLGALTLSLLLPGTVGARSGEVETAKAEHNRILAYWTPERIASAKWKSFSRDAATGKFSPNAGKPGGGGGGNVSGASWTGNGAIEMRSGRILFSSGGSNWICSGSVVTSSASGGSVVLTAGHCIFDGADGWSYNFLYMPDFDDEPNYNCDTRVLGCWTASRLSASKTFVDGGGFGTNATVAVDYGFAFVGTTGLGDLDAKYGAYGLKLAPIALSDVQYAFGYPGEGRYKGKDLIYCKGPTANDPYGANTTGIVCNMNGGSSGGPRLWNTTNPADGSGSASSVNSYTYGGGNSMYGPKFTIATQAALDDAADGGASSGVYVCPVGATENTSCPG